MPIPAKEYGLMFQPQSADVKKERSRMSDPSPPISSLYVIRWFLFEEKEYAMRAESTFMQKLNTLRCLECT